MPKKIIWAIDPYNKEKSLWSNTKKCIDLLRNKEPETEFEAVYVVGKDLIHWLGEISPQNSQKLIPLAEKLIKEKITSIGLDNISLKPLINFKPSARADAMSLVEYAFDANADMILLNTHSRSTLEKLFMGSFTESVLRFTQVPCLILNPHSEIYSQWDKVLYPTDFSDQSFHDYKKLFDLKLKYFDQVQLYSKVRPILPDFFTSEMIFADDVEPNLYITKEVEYRNELAKEWRTYAERHKKSFEFICDDVDENLTDGILKTANDNNSSFICVCSHKKELSKNILGSTAINVMRNARLPVLFLNAH